jgi:23S rRNA maturation-related 3'-5' exoribonuclease YhaM
MKEHEVHQIEAVLGKASVNREKTETLLDLFCEEKLATGIKEYLASCDFYTAPGSTKYHDNTDGGLAKHSLEVAGNLLKLDNAFNLDAGDAVLAGLLHDLCKINMYEKYDKDGKELWRVRYDYRAIGHGSESVRRAMSLGVTKASILEAIAFHMGAMDLSGYEEINYRKVIETNRLVLALVTADMMTIANP